MRSGHILALCLFILGAFDAWSQYNVLQRSDEGSEYIYLVWIDALFILPIIGLALHKKWALATLKVILWIWISAAFLMGTIAVNLAGSPDMLTGMIGSLKMHWLQFLIFFALLYFISTDKVKRDFGKLVVAEPVEKNEDNV